VKVDELFTRVKESVGARTVFADPVERNGTTVIPAARVAAGGGGGLGQDKHGQQGEGGGLGFTARPVGAYVIVDGKLRWEPAVDVTRMVTVFGAVVVAGLALAGRMVKYRAHRR
jgi:uncharacterized spore protein YtfJ